MIYITLGTIAVFIVLGQTFFLYLALKNITSIEEEKVKFERDKRKEELRREKMWIDSLSKTPPEEGAVPIEQASDMDEVMKENFKGEVND